MKTINELIKENKLFTGKVYDKLKPVERDAIHDIIKFVEEDKSNIDFMSKFDKWIDNVCEKYNVEPNRIQQIIDDQINESVGEII
tara:strand:+ start:653 stop:907 length:255 start_codon:yes stop_codon:yes gene_type:complete